MLSRIRTISVVSIFFYVTGQSSYGDHRCDLSNNVRLLRSTKFHHDPFMPSTPFSREPYGYKLVTFLLNDNLSDLAYMLDFSSCVDSGSEVSPNGSLKHLHHECK